MRRYVRYRGDYGIVVSKVTEDLARRKKSQEAQDAYEAGQEASQQGDVRQACLWLGRASRIATKDAKVAFAYAMSLLKLGHFEHALACLEGCKDTLDTREIVFAEFLGLWGAERRAEAEALLEDALSRYVPPVELYSLIEALVVKGQKPGWATLSNSGLLRLYTSQPVTISLDGHKLGEFDTEKVLLGSAFQEGLCPGWAQGSSLSVKAGGEHLLGSPFNIASLTGCKSLVWPEASSLAGWLWYPAEPEFIPHIQVNNGPWLAVETSAEINYFNPLGFAKTFTIPLEDIPEGEHALIRVHNDHKVLLAGAPVEPKLGRVIARQVPYPVQYQPVSISPRPVRARARVQKNVRCVVLIPVYGDYEATMDCLKSVLETVPALVEVIVIDDASPEKKIVQALDRLAAEKKITLLRNEENLGFPASVNKGFRYAQNADVILLNSDTLVFEGWVERLRRWLTFPNVGTVTPFSNQATLLSYPSIEEENFFPDKREARLIDQFCQENGAATEMELPTANGFCMAISAECLAETGFFRSSVFAQGYGEENDFCLRATVRGFQHLAAVNVYVRHKGGSSFKKNKLPLIERNLKMLNALHPGYDMIIAEFMSRDPLRLIRRRLDFLRLAKTSRKKEVVLMIQHNYGGGVARAVQQRAEAYERKGVLALRLCPSPQGCVLESCSDPMAWPNMQFSLPEENMLLITWLRKIGVKFIEWHHLAGHAPWIRRLHELLDVPLDIFVHDHVWFCPRTILLNAEGYYCGERSVQGCRDCIMSPPVLQDDITVDELLERSRKEFLSARTITVPISDVAKRLTRHFPEIGDITINPLEDERFFPPVKPVMNAGDRPYRVGVLGGISRWKGYDILLKLGAFIQQNALPIELILIGGTKDDEALINVGIKVMGMYDDEDTLFLLDEAELDIGFIPSVAPETWSYALSWLWKAGLEVICFDIGAVSERIKRRNGSGKVLPLGLPVDRLAEYLLAHVISRKNCV